MLAAALRGICLLFVDHTIQLHGAFGIAVVIVLRSVTAHLRRTFS